MALALAAAMACPSSRAAIPPAVAALDNLLVALAIVIGAVALLLNPFLANRPSARFPNIVQDAVIVVLVFLITTFVLRDTGIVAASAASAVAGSSSGCARTRPGRPCAPSTARTAASCSASRSARSATAGRRRRSCRRCSCAPGATPGATTRSAPRSRAWLYRIARNAIIDARRRASVRPAAATREAEEQDAGGSIEQAMLGWQVAAALERLTPEHRQMIRMAQFRGMSMREIAHETGLPVGTVKSRTWYALRSLRLVLEEMGVVPQ